METSNERDIGEGRSKQTVLPASGNSRSEVLDFAYRTGPSESIRFERKKAGDYAGLSRNTLEIC
jgi:hypothetical protein